MAGYEQPNAPPVAQSFARAAGGGLLKYGAIGSALIGGAYAADRYLNDGAALDWATDGRGADFAGRTFNNFTNLDGYGHVGQIAGSAISAVKDFAVAAGSETLSLVSGPMNTPAMGIAALFAGLATLSIVKNKFDDVPFGAVGRFVSRVGIALAVAGVAAAFVANLRDEPVTDPSHTLPSAAEDLAVQAPAQPTGLSVAPPAFGGPGGS